MLVLIISFSCFYIFCAAFMLIGMWRAPYGFEDAAGFHTTGAAHSPSGESGVENAATDDDSSEDVCKSGTGEPLRRKSRIWRRTPRICRRNSGSSPRKRAQFGTS